MTGDSRSDLDVSTAAEFNAALTDLLVRATAAGVDVQGAWTCRPGDLDGHDGHDGLDWEAAVVELDDRH